MSEPVTTDLRRILAVGPSRQLAMLKNLKFPPPSSAIISFATDTKTVKALLARQTFHLLLIISQSVPQRVLLKRIQDLKLLAPMLVLGSALDYQNLALEALQKGAEEFIITDGLPMERLALLIHRLAEKVEYSRQLQTDAQYSKSFIRQMSYEVKTPVYGILKIANLMLETDLKAKQRQKLETIRRSSENIVRTLSDILDVSQIDTGKIKIETHFTREDALDLTASPSTPHSPGEKRVLELLVVDDSRLNLVITQNILHYLGHKCQIESDTLKALEIIKAQNFDLIFMDCKMPGMDGFATTRKIRALGGKYLQIPIIALTAYSVDDQLEICLKSGMNDIITKPVEISKLSEALDRWSKKAEGLATASPSDEASSVSELEPEAVEVDPAQLDSLAALADSSEEYQLLVTHFIDLFLVTSPEVIADLHQAITAEDKERVSFLAHKLKGMSCDLGAKTLYRFCANLETAAHSSNTPRNQQQIKRLQLVYERTISQLADFKKRRWQL